MAKTFHIGRMRVGGTPVILGTISTIDMLRKYKPDARHPDGNAVEARLDRIGTANADWLKHCLRIQKEGIPVVATLRLSREGGMWKKSDESRLSVLQNALDHLSSIDVEFHSHLCAPLSERAVALGKNIIVSFHDFNSTPSLVSLKTILKKMTAIPCAIPKITTMIRNDRDVLTLMKLLDVNPARPVCIIGMGQRATRTRIILPCVGSCLAYGFIDTSGAPGQLHARVFTRYLRQLIPEYDRRFIDRKVQ